MLIILSILSLKRVARARLVGRFNGGVRQRCSSFVVYFEDQACEKVEYYRMFEGDDLAILSGLGRRYKPYPRSSLHLRIRANFVVFDPTD
jgi:hypothetical protein